MWFSSTESLGSLFQPGLCLHGALSLSEVGTSKYMDVSQGGMGRVWERRRELPSQLKMSRKTVPGVT